MGSLQRTRGQIKHQPINATPSTHLVLFPHHRDFDRIHHSPHFKHERYQRRVVHAVIGTQSTDLWIASTWTCDVNDDDPRRMVITPGMISQKADVHRDSLGRHYSQLPPYYGLCYAITYTNIYNMCKAFRVWNDGERCHWPDECFTIYKWMERLEQETGISRGKGLYECELKDGQLLLSMVIACSDKLDTVPRPTARIDAFKKFLRVKRDPVVKKFNQPKMYC
ncbi:hypothetical protein GGG16DRAFT_117351 [Schizophyllum commune]